MLDGELGSLRDDVVLAEAVHDGTKGTEIDAARGRGQPSLFHRGIPQLDDVLIDVCRSDFVVLALDFKRPLFGASLDVTRDFATEEAIEALQGIQVLLACLLSVLAVAELFPVFKEGDSLVLRLLRTSEDVLQVLEGEVVFSNECVDGIVDFLEDLADLSLGLADFGGASLDDERLGIVIGCERYASGQIQLVVTAANPNIYRVRAIFFHSSHIVERVHCDMLSDADEERFVHGWS